MESTVTFNLSPSKLSAVFVGSEQIEHMTPLFQFISAFRPANLHFCYSLISGLISFINAFALSLPAHIETPPVIFLRAPKALGCFFILLLKVYLIIMGNYDTKASVQQVFKAL